MPPKGKAVWIKPKGNTETIDIGTEAAAAAAPAVRPVTAAQGETDLRRYVLRTLRESNLLRLAEEELESTAEILLSAKERAEVQNWAATLMLGEGFASEVIRRREAIQAAAKTEAETTSVTGSAATTGTRGRKNRGVQKMRPMSTAEDPTGGLVEGAFFECGCFATQHQFKSGCNNCGRVFCMQEDDSEACYACGLPPGECLAFEIKAQEGRVDEAADARNREELRVALERRDALLKFATERSRRTLVVDDQSGMFNPADVWKSKEQRDADHRREAEQRRVAEMHKRSGAYTVHLDIVNQNASLGAVTVQSDKTPEAAAVGDEPQCEEARAADAVERANRVGFTSDAQGSTASLAPAVPIAIRHRQAAAARAAAGSSSDGSDASDSDSDCRGTGRSAADERRVMPLPSLLQSIFYAADGTAAATAGMTTAKRRGTAATDGGGDDSGAGAKKAAGFRPRGEDAKDVVARAEVASRRVQIDYYEDDRATWGVAKQNYAAQLRGSAAAGSRDDPAFDGADDEADATAFRQAAEHERQDQQRRRHIDPALMAGGSGGDDGGGGDGADVGPSPAENPEAQRLAAEARFVGQLFHKDGGWCLSMHQPWASLLIAGIKTHEGRSWDAEHRGRLWIHAAAAKPADVEAIEAKYATFLPPGGQLPDHYPTSCLLGHVTVSDCLGLEAYEARFLPSERQEESPFKLICHRATQLPFALAMDGKHKIFKLDRKVWQAARKQMGEKPQTR